MLGGIWRELLGDGAKHVRAVLFDAVGTLVTPTPPVADVYHAFGQRHGSERSQPEVAARFRAAFAASASPDGRSDEGRELERWRRIVGEVFDDLHDPAPLFLDLWNHFADPASWRLADGAAEMFAAVRAAEAVPGVASNFDARLHRVLAGRLPETPIFVSSEVGWQKPHAGFFRAIEQRLGLPPREICLVGDDWEQDILGARHAGWQAIWLGDGDSKISAVARIRSLWELLSP